MMRDDEVDGGHRRGADGLIPQVVGAGDSKKGNKTTSKKATPKKSRTSTPTTPSRRGGGGGRGGANATTPTRSTRSSAALDRAAAYNNTLPNTTDISDIYIGPPAAAFTTLRHERSASFKALLHHLEHVAPLSVTRRAGLDNPLSVVLEQDREAVDAHKDSPADSGIDVLTPSQGLGQVTKGNEQFGFEVEQMAPIQEISQAERDRLRERNQQVEVLSSSLKDVIHNYYEVQAQVHGYVSETETRDVLVNKVQDLSQSLAHLARESSSNTITNTFIPPEVIDYVDDGRNPDIYTRELVEVVQRGNAVLNGKMNAFGSFSKIFADELRKMSPEMAKAVDEIVGVSNGGAQVNEQENGGSRQT